MSDVFFKELGMSRPDYLLDIHGGGHSTLTCRMLEWLVQAMQVEQHDAVRVHVGNDSTFAGTLAASKLHIPVAYGYGRAADRIVKALAGGLEA
jgi:UDP-GlcNAc3NAcA epimerase